MNAVVQFWQTGARDEHVSKKKKVISQLRNVVDKNWVTYLHRRFQISQWHNVSNPVICKNSVLTGQRKKNQSHWPKTIRIKIDQTSKTEYVLTYLACLANHSQYLWVRKLNEWEKAKLFPMRTRLTFLCLLPEHFSDKTDCLPEKITPVSRTGAHK